MIKKIILAIIFIAAVFVAFLYLNPSDKVKKVEIKNKAAVSEDSSEVVQENFQDNAVEAEESEVIDEGKTEDLAVIVTTEKEKEDKENIQEKEIKTESSKADQDEKISSPKINQKLVSFGFQSVSGRKIDTIIIHSSYNSLGGDQYDTDKIINIYKSYGVAAHYIISRKGKIYQLVRDKDIAYHAGVSSVPDGRINVNSFSIGIELVNNKKDEYTSDQYNSLNNLIAYLKNEYDIKYTLGHNQIAPERKTDPWNFKWSKIK